MPAETSESPIYPGENANPREILNLAEAYYLAAISLCEMPPKHARLSQAPARLCSIHAIELYLNAFLRFQGVSPGEIRGRLHDLKEPDFAATLGLRKRTAAHLLTITDKREYLISRYAPEMTGHHSELSRLIATLKEVHKKTTKYIQLKIDV
ncbi:MAG: hypothetical protein AAF366_19810 [Pseudomonadota bacterium]